MASYVAPTTLKKFFAAANPFARKPAPPAPSDEPPTDTHTHSFSCPCTPCDAETTRQTLERLKRQGA